MTKDEIQSIVRETLIDLLCPGSLSQNAAEQWMGLDKAWTPLGYPSYQALHKDVTDCLDKGRNSAIDVNRGQKAHDGRLISPPQGDG